MKTLPPQNAPEQARAAWSPNRCQTAGQPQSGNAALFSQLLGGMTDGAGQPEMAALGAETAETTQDAPAGLALDDASGGADEQNAMASDDPTLPFLALINPPVDAAGQTLTGNPDPHSATAEGVNAKGDKGAALMEAGKPEKGGLGAKAQGQAQGMGLGLGLDQDREPKVVAIQKAKGPPADLTLPTPAAEATARHAPWSAWMTANATAQPSPAAPTVLPGSAALAALTETSPRGGADTDSGANTGSGGSAAWVDLSASVAAPGDAGTSEQATDFGMSLGEALGDAYESLGTEISLWAASNTKKANVRLELGNNETLDVDVSIQEGKAQLAFRTDDTAVRETIRAQAGSVLTEQFAKAGLMLEGFWVGTQAQGQSPQRPPYGSPSERGQSWRLDRANNGPAEVVPVAGMNTPSVGGRGLDVYA